MLYKPCCVFFPDKIESLPWQKIVNLLHDSGFNIFELETMQEADKKWGTLSTPVLLSTSQTVHLPLLLQNQNLMI